MSKVQQKYKDDSKPSNIVRKFGGQIPGMPQQQPMFMDLYNVPEYHEALNQVTKVNQDFARLPAKIRNRFQNSPTKLVEFCQDKENLIEAIDLGLVPESARPKPKEPSTPKPQEAAKSAKPAEK